MNVVKDCGIEQFKQLRESLSGCLNADMNINKHVKIEKMV